MTVDSRIFQGLFAYSIFFMRKKELIKYAKKNKINFKRTMKKNDLLELIIYDRKKNIFSQIFNQKMIYKNIQDIIEKYICWKETELEYLRPLEYSKYRTMLLFQFDIKNDRKSLINWFSKFKYSISDLELKSMNLYTLRWHKTHELDKAYSMLHPIDFHTKQKQKDWLKELLYSKNDREKITKNKQIFKQHILDYGYYSQFSFVNFLPKKDKDIIKIMYCLD